MEVWKKIQGFENYEISSLGRIKVNLKFRKYRDYQSKILNPSLDKDGYLRTALTKEGKKYMKPIHRLVALNFITNTNKKPCVNHKNGIKTDNRIENLEWCTHSENVKHAYASGLKKKSSYCGEGNSSSKVTEEQVIAMREEFKQGNISYKELAIKYGVKQNTIGYIITKKTWKYV